MRYLHGHGVAVDATEGMLWLQKAAAQGHTEARIRLKELFANDRQPLVSSPSQAGAAQVAAAIVATASLVAPSPAPAAAQESGGHRPPLQLVPPPPEQGV